LSPARSCTSTVARAPVIDRNGAAARAAAPVGALQVDQWAGILSACLRLKAQRPAHEREHSLFGEQCSVVRFTCLEGLVQRAMAGNHACVWSNVSNRRLCLDRSVRLSSLTRRGCQFASSSGLWVLPSALLAICSRDRCNLNYSFFGLRLWPYEGESASLHKGGLDRRKNRVSIPSAVKPFPHFEWARD
jgi:hypothetical protein